MNSRRRRHSTPGAVAPCSYHLSRSNFQTIRHDDLRQEPVAHPWLLRKIPAHSSGAPWSRAGFGSAVNHGCRSALIA